MSEDSRDLESSKSGNENGEVVAIDSLSRNVTLTRTTGRTGWRSAPRRSFTPSRIFKGRGISEAFTKKTSNTTFAPNFNSDPPISVEFKRYEKPKMRALDLNNINYNHNAVGLKSKKRNYRGIIGAMIVVGIFLTIGIIFGAKVGEKDVEKGEEQEENEVEQELCQLGDQHEREIIAAEFDAALTNSRTLEYFGVLINCLPSDAFGALSESQKNSLAEVDTLIFDSNAMEKISDQAFNAPELQNLKRIEVIYNILTFLGDDLLTPLQNLENVSFRGNSFTKLDSEVFRNSNVAAIDLSQNPFFEIPRALIGCEQVTDIDFRLCGSMIVFEEEMFVNVPLFNLDLTGTGLFFLFSNTEELEQRLGVDKGVIIEDVELCIF